MAVELQSDLIVSPFWKDVQRHLAEALADRCLGDWTVILRPKTRADDDFTDEPEKFNLTPREARELEDSNFSSDVDEQRRQFTFAFPQRGGGETWLDPDSGDRLDALNFALELANHVEILAD